MIEARKNFNNLEEEVKALTAKVTAIKSDLSYLEQNKTTIASKEQQAGESAPVTSSTENAPKSNEAEKETPEVAAPAPSETTATEEIKPPSQEEPKQTTPVSVTEPATATPVDPKPEVTAPTPAAQPAPVGNNQNPSEEAAQSAAITTVASTAQIVDNNANQKGEAPAATPAQTPVIAPAASAVQAPVVAAPAEHKETPVAQPQAVQVQPQVPVQPQAVSVQPEPGMSAAVNYAPQPESA